MEPYIGQISLFAFDFIPQSWAPCDGRVLSIQQYQALFSLIGTSYGGDGMRTFALPDLRGRFPMSISDLHAIGRQDGSAKVTLTWADMPPHNHSLQMSTMPATNGAPANAVLGAKGRFGRDLMGPADSNLEASALGSTGGNFAHENMPPYLALTFAIALQGLFPSHW